MLKRRKSLPKLQALVNSAMAQQKGVLTELMDGYSRLTIDDPQAPFMEENLDEVVNNVDYGVLKVLEGTWVSYNAQYNTNINRPMNGSGIHTTIMPSPGTNSGTIPGKFSFECEEFIEKLTFELVPGGVRNRGGANEQFCGAVKYDQTVKSVTKPTGQPNLKYTPIHEENGMFLWLSDIYNHAATAESIKRDRGIHAVSEQDRIKYGYQGSYRDEPLVRITPDGSPQHKYIELSQLQPGQSYYELIPAKELKPGAGNRGPYFIPDYSISRSGVIPHGSTIYLLGDLVSQNGKFLLPGKPQFPEGDATWDYNFLSISPTMGGGGGPINLDQPAPDWVHEELNDQNDPGEQKSYTQRILAHELYPYSVRPDMRLRDTLRDQKGTNHVQINLSSKHATGAQGGILNVPFVNRFVPSVEVNMRMWVETIFENGKEILQLQYEQIIFFEFHFGDSGGTTSWPHIQVNTLRKMEDLPEDQRKVIKEQFFNPSINTQDDSASSQQCPYHK